MRPVWNLFSGLNRKLNLIFQIPLKTYQVSLFFFTPAHTIYLFPLTPKPRLLYISSTYKDRAFLKPGPGSSAKLEIPGQPLHPMKRRERIKAGFPFIVNLFALTLELGLSMSCFLHLESFVFLIGNTTAQKSLMTKYLLFKRQQ